MKAKGKTFVVTGGGSGMGQTSTLELIKRGANVAIADISLAGMDQTKNLAQVNEDQLKAYELDITDQKAVEAFRDNVINDFGSIDGLINNAGIINLTACSNPLCSPLDDI